MFRRFLLLGLLFGTLSCANPNIPASFNSTGDIRVSFTDLKIDDQDFGSVTLTLDPATGKTVGTEVLPEFGTSRSVSWSRATTRFSFKASDKSLWFDWTLNESRLSGVRFAAADNKDQTLLGMLESFSVESAAMSGGEIRLIDGAGGNPRDIDMDLLHQAISLKGLAAGRIGELAIAETALTVNLGSGPDPVALAIQIDRSSLTGLDLAYPATAISIANDSVSLSLPLYVNALLDQAESGVGYDSFAYETITGAVQLGVQKFSFGLDDYRSGAYRGYVAGPGSMSGIRFADDTGQKLMIRKVTASGYDLSSAATGMRDIVDNRPELLEENPEDPFALLAALPEMDIGKYSIEGFRLATHIGQGDIRFDSLTFDDLRINREHQLSIGFSLKELAVWKGYFSGPENQLILEVLNYAGLDRLVTTIDYHSILDARTRSLNLDRFDLALDGLISFISSVQLSGLQPADQDGQTPAPLLDSASIDIINDKFLDAILASHSVSGNNPEWHRRDAKRSISSLRASMTTSSGKAVYDEVIRFLDGAPRLSLSLAPEKPVPLDQVAGLLTLSADAAVQFLGLKVTAGP